jgi:hypothetical protein
MALLPGAEKIRRSSSAASSKCLSKREAAYTHLFTSRQNFPISRLSSSAVRGMFPRPPPRYRGYPPRPEGINCPNIPILAVRRFKKPRVHAVDRSARSRLWGFTRRRGARRDRRRIPPRRATATGAAASPGKASSPQKTHARRGTLCGHKVKMASAPWRCAGIAFATKRFSFILFRHPSSLDPRPPRFQRRTAA